MSYRMVSTANPTALRIGQSGRLDGKNYVVLGRVMLTTADGYFWQEFHLGTTEGDEATLVYEEGTWKLYRRFVPTIPLRMAEVTTTRADDVLTLDAASIVVTYTGRSLVAQVEGQPPAGVKLGDRDGFFNADRHDGQVVVTWGKARIEYYAGNDLAVNVVETAFGLPRRSWLQRAATTLGVLRQVDRQYWITGAFFLAVALAVVVPQFEFSSYRPPESAGQAGGPGHPSAQSGRRPFGWA